MRDADPFQHLICLFRGLAAGETQDVPGRTASTRTVLDEPSRLPSKVLSRPELIVVEYA